MKKRTRYRTVFVSDVHLGSRGCQAAQFCRFLKHIECDKLYLVGDIVDFWRLRSKPFWPTEHNEVLRRLLKLVKRGTRVVYIPGNHDEALRQYAGLDFGGIDIRKHHIHETADHRKLLITHGDHFDLVIRHSRWLSMLGSVAYEWLVGINRYYNKYRAWRGKPYWSLSQYLKLKVKSACTHISAYQETLLTQAEKLGLQGVVCGHIHKPELMEDVNMDYYNSGDWIENCTAIVEDYTGKMKLVQAADIIDDAEEAIDPSEIDFVVDQDDLALNRELELLVKH